MIAAGIIVTVVASAYLTFGQTLSTIEMSGSDDPPSYFVIGSALVAMSTALIGWHALWFGCVLTALMSIAWQVWVFDVDRCLGGMDGIGCQPTSVLWTLAFFLPVAVLAATLRRTVSASHRHRPNRGAS